MNSHFQTMDKLLASDHEEVLFVVPCPRDSLEADIFIDYADIFC